MEGGKGKTSTLGSQQSTLTNMITLLVINQEKVKPMLMLPVDDAKEYPDADHSTRASINVNVSPDLQKAID